MTLDINNPKPQFDLVHIGVNAKDSEEAVGIVKTIADIFGMELRVGGKGSPFAGKAIEAMAGNGRGEKGHIAFYTEDILAAIAFLENKGVVIDHASAKRNENGDIYLVYLQQEVAGFAFHLINRK
jgi:catechol 2,3-dioxygenase-like lactoylglutathione lyase family enzyme